MEAAQRQLLFKLTLCKGIGNRSKLNILAQSQAQQRTDFSETELLTYGEVTRYKEIISQFLALLFTTDRTLRSKTTSASIF